MNVHYRMGLCVVIFAMICSVASAQSPAQPVPNQFAETQAPNQTVNVNLSDSANSLTDDHYHPHIDWQSEVPIQLAHVPDAAAEPNVVAPTGISNSNPAPTPGTSPAAIKPTKPGTGIDNPKAKKPQPKNFPKKIKSAHKGVFYANDFSYLCDPSFCGPYYFGDQFKNLWYQKLDIGGEIRTRFHRERGIRGLGLTGRDDDFLLTRGRLYSDFELSSNIRLYAEYLYADSGGETFNNRPIEENRNEIQNLFVDFKLPAIENGNVNVRLGRQELLLGAQRLVSPLDWANTRRTFQGGRVTVKKGPMTMDAFLVNPVNRNAQNESSIDEANSEVTFYGSYFSLKQKDSPVLDFYLLGLNNNLAQFDNQTIGSRISGKNGQVLYEAEGGFQFGTNSDGTGHNAGFVTCGVGHKLARFANTPVIWFWYDWASGGDDSLVSRGDNSFDHLFPLAHKYLGLADLYGRRNINDANIQLIVPGIDPRFKFMLWYHYMFLHEKTTPYGVTLAPFNTTALAGDRELGHELDMVFTYQANPRNRFTLGYSHFFSGKYYNTTPGVPETGDGSFLFSEYQIRF